MLIAQFLNNTYFVRNIKEIKTIIEDVSALRQFRYVSIDCLSQDRFGGRYIRSERFLIGEKNRHFQYQQNKIKLDELYETLCKLQTEGTQKKNEREQLLKYWTQILSEKSNSQYEFLIYLQNLGTFYEHQRYLVGFLLALFDSKNGNLFSDLENYYSDKFYTKNGFYKGRRMVLSPNKKKVTKTSPDSGLKSLSSYLEHDNYKTIK